MMKFLTNFLAVLMIAQSAAATPWRPVPVDSTVSAISNPRSVCDERRTTDEVRRECIPWRDYDKNKNVFSQKLRWQQIDSRELSVDETCEMLGYRKNGRKCADTRAGRRGTDRDAPGINIDGIEMTPESGGGWNINLGNSVNVGASRILPRRDNSLLLGIYDRQNFVFRIIAVRVNVGAPPCDDSRAAITSDLTDTNCTGKLRGEFKVRVFQAALGPRYFDLYKGRGIWKDEDDNYVHEAGYSGINPWSRFDRDDGANLFHNIEFAAAAAALAEAQHRLRTPIAYLVTAQPELKTNTKGPYGIIVSRFETWVEGKLVPEWFVLVDNDKGGEQMANAKFAAFCAIPNDTQPQHADGTKYCPESAIVESASSFVHMSGGNMPETEQLIYNKLHSTERGISVLAMGLIVAGVALATGGLLAPEAAAIAGGYVSAGGAALGLEIGASLGYAIAAGAVGAGYIGGHEIAGDAGAGDYQKYPFGSKIGDGTVLPWNANPQTESDIKYQSMESENEHYSAFALAAHDKLNPCNERGDGCNPRNSMKAVKCMWGGCDGANDEDFIADNTEGNINAASAELNALRDKKELAAFEAIQATLAVDAATAHRAVETQYSTGKAALNKLIAQENIESYTIYDTVTGTEALVGHVDTNAQTITLHDKAANYQSKRYSYRQIEVMLNAERFEIREQ